MPVWPAASTMADVVSLAASYLTCSRCPTRDQPPLPRVP
jgi:hypothetical protein